MLVIIPEVAQLLCPKSPAAYKSPTDYTPGGSAASFILFLEHFCQRGGYTLTFEDGMIRFANNSGLFCEGPETVQFWWELTKHVPNEPTESYTPRNHYFIEWGWVIQEAMTETGGRLMAHGRHRTKRRWTTSY